MYIHFILNNISYKADISHPIDISIPLVSGKDNPNAFFAPDPLIEPVRTNTFVGSTEEGGTVNFKNIQINPHGNGTHTECVGHIAKEKYTIQQCLKQFHYTASLITLNPKTQNNDRIITKAQIEDIWNDEQTTEALIIRTLPNTEDKKTQCWSGTNPPYIDHLAMEYLVDRGVNHLLVDLPSVDREEDEGKLLAHKIFWAYPSAYVRENATITEMVYIPPHIQDGLYIVNIQIISLEMDASPSKVVLFPTFVKN